MKKILLLTILLLAHTLSGQAAAAEISAVKVVHHPELYASFIVKDAFTEDIEEAIKSGVPTSFTFLIQLEAVRGLWFDKNVERWEFKHTVKYDTLKEEYEITLEESDELVTRTKDLGEMKRLMTTGESIRLTTSRPLKNGKEYRLSIKAELHTVKLPFFLDYVLFFVKLWDFETDWHKVRFTNQ
jgi:hypothetical protein